MFVHNVLFAGSYEGKYFKKVTVVDNNEEFEIEHETYLEIFGQSEELPSARFSDYAHECSEHLNLFDNEAEEHLIEKEKEKLKAWHSLSGLDVHIFNVKPHMELVIEVWS